MIHQEETTPFDPPAVPGVTSAACKPVSQIVASSLLPTSICFLRQQHKHFILIKPNLPDSLAVGLNRSGIRLVNAHREDTHCKLFSELKLWQELYEVKTDLLFLFQWPHALPIVLTIKPRIVSVYWANSVIAVQCHVSMWCLFSSTSLATHIPL